MTKMDVISFTDLRQNLASVMDEVTQSGTHVIITRQKSRPAVMMSLDEFHGWVETLRLMRSPANAARLLRAVDDIEKGRVTARALIEVEGDDGDGEG
jgi:antitoxin YefM